VRLYLVQHGDAVGEDVDPQRPLSAAGRADVEKVAAFLGSAGLRVGAILHSGKCRAQQSAAILGSALASDHGPRAISGIAPKDDVRAFKLIAGEGVDCLVVGHLPFLARLVAELVCGDPERTLVAYRPGSVVCLESTEEANWVIVWMLRPELLSRP
jgi:phosphohistidine phosphatase